MGVITYRGTSDQVRAVLRRLPAALAGRAPDPLGIARGIQLRLGVALLSKIQQAFIVKSRGGTGDDGIRWAPLKPQTIAQRRTTRTERRAAGVGGRRVRGLLTPAQDRRWRMLFATRRARLVASGMSEGAASARAAAIAWSILKSEGAQTKLAVFGGRTVDILRDTGELFRSLQPGVEDRPARPEGQIFEVPPGRIIVGTNKKPWHHRGVPGRLPARPLWPLDGRIPEAWLKHLAGAARRGVARAIGELLARGGLPL